MSIREVEVETTCVEPSRQETYLFGKGGDTEENGVNGSRELQFRFDVNEEHEEYI